MADSNASRFLITGATGNQGNVVAHQLLSTGHNVNALIRDTTKPAAQALEFKGATIIQGDYDNLSALSTAAHNCQGIFLLTVPGTDEVQNALNILTIAKQAGIATVVCSTVARAEEYKLVVYYLRYELQSRLLSKGKQSQYHDLSEVAKFFQMLESYPHLDQNIIRETKSTRC